MATPYQNLGQQLGGLVGLLGDQTDSSAYIEGRRGGYAVQKAMEEASRARNQRIISDQRVEMRNRLATAMPADGTQGQPGADILGDVYGDAAPLVRAITLANETVDLDRAGPLAKPGALDAFREAERVLGDTVDAEDIQAAARAQSFLSGKAYDPVVTGGGVMRPQGMALGDPGFQAVPLPQTQASIDNQARRTAIAAGKAGGRPAAGGGAAKPAKPMTQAQADADVLARARAAIAGGADPAAVAQRLRDRGYPGLAAKVYVAPVPDVE